MLKKLKKADIVIGIPSFCEEESISYVVSQVDKSLFKYFKQKKAVIVNVDNHSPDKTKERFLSVKTKNPKIYISTKKGVKGKGNNLKNLFKVVKRLDAKAAATVDADLKSINEKWIRCMLKPVLSGYHFLTPLYLRSRYDGSITNHLCYPLVYGMLGYDIRQPIGGDMAFSGKMADYWLNQKWPDSAGKFGIDIFMTLNAIKSGYKMGQINLGVKAHKPSAPKLDNMFLEVSSTLFWFLSQNPNLWQKKIAAVKKPSIISSKLKTGSKYPDLKFDWRDLEKKALGGFGKNSKKFLPADIQQDLESIILQEKGISVGQRPWRKMVYSLFLVYQASEDKKRIIELLRTLYLLRTVSFSKQVSHKSEKEAEKIIRKQAEEFFRNRNCLFQAGSCAV